MLGANPIPISAARLKTHIDEGVDKLSEYPSKSWVLAFERDACRAVVRMLPVNGNPSRRKRAKLDVWRLGLHIACGQQEE
jgi:hypothetical protein